MAKIFDESAYTGAYWDLAVAIHRTQGAPLDSTSVFTSYKAAEKYAKNLSETQGPTAYVGQIISVTSDETNGNLVTAYIISDEAGTLTPLASGSSNADIGVSAEVIDIIEIPVGEGDNVEFKYFESTDTTFSNEITSKYVKDNGAGSYVKLTLTDDVDSSTERPDVVYIKNIDIIDVSNYYTKDEVDEIVSGIDTSINVINSSITEIVTDINNINSSIVDISNYLNTIDSSIERIDASIDELYSIIGGEVVNSVNASTNTQFVLVSPIDTSYGDVTIGINLDLKDEYDVSAALVDSSNGNYASNGISTDGFVKKYVDDKMSWVEVEDDEDTDVIEVPDDDDF